MMNMVKPNSQNDIAIVEGLRRCKGDRAHRKPNVQKRFLVVDDSIEIRFSLRRVLRGGGAREIDVADSGPAAIQMITQAIRAKQHYDVVLIDYMMPGMSGIETLYELRRRQIAEAEGTRFIMLTGFYDPQISTEAVSVGAAMVLAKPCDAASLMAAIA